MQDEAQGLVEFDRQLFAHMGYSISNAVRSLLLGLSFARFSAVPSDRKTARYYRKLTRYSAVLAFASDVIMLTLGGKLKHKESTSARLGDVLSQLYICSAMLKRFEMQGRPAADQPFLAWAFHDSIYKMQTALRKVVDNFPSRAVRLLLAHTCSHMIYDSIMPLPRLTTPLLPFLRLPRNKNAVHSHRPRFIGECHAMRILCGLI